MIQRAQRIRPAASKLDHVRVACYCRVSVAERGETQFSSIDAQREALESYVASQRVLGWRAVDERYVDDGYSGGSVDRPAFQRLLADARAGRFDVLAVVKFDRLSRTQIDFLRTVEELDQLGVRFVSTTQNLDTSNSMGRCMLGIMASFAQLEREVIAERTRAKVGAARKKGLWTGGRVVLGYDVVNKRLIVNEPEAEVVRRIFELYIEIGGLVATVEELRLRGVSNKRWTTKAGGVQGGSLFEKNSLGTTLRNVLYVGCVRAGDEVVEGQHAAIVQRDVWDAVQARLAAQAPNTGARVTRRSSALLSGLVRCKCGAAMTPTTAKGRGRTYAYYACARALKQGSNACPKSRVPAGEIEQFVVEQVREFARKPEVLDAAIAADREERGLERAKLAAEVGELRVGRGRHIGDRDRLITAIGQGTAPASLVARVEELDGLVALADARMAGLERDLAALAGTSDIQALKAALDEFEGVWGVLDLAERARVLSLILDEVVVDGAGGDAELRFRGPR